MESGFAYYVTRRVHGGDLVIQTDVDRAEGLGFQGVSLRRGWMRCASPHSLAVEEAADLSRRFNNNQAEIFSGVIRKIVAVVRVMWRCQ
jgi:RNA polymerase-interacting CarD/CdnL/TRCF family regulator